MAPPYWILRRSQELTVSCGCRSLRSCRRTAHASSSAQERARHHQRLSFKQPGQPAVRGQRTLSIPTTVLEEAWTQATANRYPARGAAGWALHTATGQASLITNLFTYVQACPRGPGRTRVLPRTKPTSPPRRRRHVGAPKTRSTCLPTFEPTNL